ncbi:MAG: hypothetical protein A3D96_04365 [Chlamydiae bacterium RIFCSPHIGHO2_12_FULL_44_59]|nr:MAG: hypothetical protein A2796_04140 [Chlamydiae bacterium RIFCSPHIGHO2_01_FULL_44_39]OGN56464.1 MAG: hypothetical protein A3C42_02205 [Chlamydiae bacterium RIFCSPHIGHO2_02_FULL_45_9]OGN60323.1 MAG: hypothetical protein A3D96_04365 [Chlamydiae bacterium RIFCSPHIGHO2_12_FULL_44_59]OGN66306.1 MAG: hypothetical protein A2978_01810 [Chlamydiae bacterium RIFCSPLOWO2_01_FULL_44_52]OGN69257.1 MAG: hypothetical protein A3I67_00670 [Chlamydiae bacterium RIFCSPLOWO2_02_FULL_45_22]OGN70197.1 MAG: hyp
MSEINFSPVEDEFERYHEALFFHSTSSLQHLDLSGTILSWPVCSRPLTQQSVLYAVQSGVAERIQKVTQNNGLQIAPMEAGGSVEVKVEANWGGKDGPGVQIGASGEIHDNHGNYAKGEVTQDSSGEGRTSLSAGHKETSKGE